MDRNIVLRWLAKLLGAIFIGIVVGVIVWVVGMILSAVPFPIVQGIGVFLVKVAPLLGLLAGLLELAFGAGYDWWKTRHAD